MFCSSQQFDWEDLFRSDHMSSGAPTVAICVQSINIRLIKAWQNAGLYNWEIRHTNKNVISNTAIKDHVPDRVKPSVVIFDIPTL